MPSTSHSNGAANNDENKIRGCSPADVEVEPVDAGPGAATVPADLRYGTPLVLSTAAAADSTRAAYLFVEPAP